MKLLELRQKVHEAWERLNSFKGILVQAEQFKVEMKQFGDLRRKDTWSKALARFEAFNIYKSCLDAYCLILNDFNFTPDRWDYEFRYQIVDEFLMMPDGIDMIRLGLEQLFSSTFTPQEREEAHGFFELVAEQGSRNRLPVGLVRQLSGTSAARLKFCPIVQAEISDIKLYKVD